MSAKFNIFQKTMLAWNREIPYNAVHWVRIKQRFEETRFRDIIAQYFKLKKLGAYEVAGSTYNYDISTEKSIVMDIKDSNGHSNAIDEEVQSQINQPFDLQGSAWPLRIFVVEENQSFYWGICYFHAIADAFSLIQVLKEITRIYLKELDFSAVTSFKVYPNVYWKRSFKFLSLWAKWIFSLPGHLRRVKSYARLTPVQSKSVMGFKRLSIDGATTRTLLQNAKEKGVTFNDMLMTALMTSLMQSKLSIKKHSRRKLIAIGCIVNLRKDMGINDPSAFGLFLGSFSVSHPIQPTLEFNTLLSHVHQRTTRVKAGKLYLRNLLELFIARLWFRLLNETKRKGLYGKHFPLWGGVTNVNLNKEWDLVDSNAVKEYWRAVSVSPATPLVVSLTSSHDEMNICLTYDQKIYSDDTILGIIQRMKSCLTT